MENTLDLLYLDYESEIEYESTHLKNKFKPL